LNNAGFSVPSTIGNYSFSLQFNNRNIFSQMIVSSGLATGLKAAAAADRFDRPGVTLTGHRRR